MSAKEKLLPCPFCGGEAEAVTLAYKYVRCDNCHFCIARSTIDEAISAWNRRTPLAAVETPLKWSDRSYGAEAITPFGSYRVYSGGGLTSPKWSYCFDEYYDEDEFECDSIDQGKALAQAHWDERVRSIFQVRTAPAAPNGWQPIETAPRDGTDVLLWDGEEIFVGYWSDSIWVSPGAWVKEEHRSDTVTYTPTHWMPLPAAPTEARDDADAARAQAAAAER